MSEKIYALLLRLYPAGFRSAYGEEALQLLRDRLHDEVGFLARLRLWFDLLLDLSASVPRERRALHRPALAPIHPETGLFRVLDEPPLRPGSFLLGSILALSGAIAFFTLLNHAGLRHAARATEDQPASATLSRSVAASSAGTTLNGNGNASAIASSSSVSAQPRTARQNPAEAPLRVSLAALPMDPAERHRVIAGVADNLRRYYFDHALAEVAANALLAQEKGGADDGIANGNGLAATLTRQLRSSTGDMHLDVVYSVAPLPAAPVAPSPEDLARYRQTLLAQNCAIEDAKVLPGPIGYLKINAFPDPSICGSQFRSAITSLDRSRALIVDLRDNGGGDPAMVALVSGYLFSRPQPWYNPREAAPSTLAAPVSGSQLGDKPVYILTSKLTISGAEQFAYNLKMLHRATLVGEITAGAVHAGTFHRIDGHFGIGIPEFRIVNPYSGRDWQSVGVRPDIPVPAADALAIAQELAEHRLATSAHQLR